MGKASRRKRERREGVISTDTVAQDDSKIPVLFRLFREEQHADAFVSGKVRLSTLQACRGYEGAGQGDRGEGTAQYLADNITSDDPRFAEAARKFGVVAGGFSGCSITNSVARQKLPDAYVLCLSKAEPDQSMTEEFGRYCVQIFDPRGLFFAINNRLFAVAQVRVGRWGPVKYVGRSYDARSGLPHHIGFMKPEEGYSNQQEVRMLWEMLEDIRKPYLDLDIGDASAFCRRYDIRNSHIASR